MERSRSSGGRPFRRRRRASGDIWEASGPPRMLSYDYPNQPDDAKNIMIRGTSNPQGYDSLKSIKKALIDRLEQELSTTSDHAEVGTPKTPPRKSRTPRPPSSYTAGIISPREKIRMWLLYNKRNAAKEERKGRESAELCKSERGRTSRSLSRAEQEDFRESEDEVSCRPQSAVEPRVTPTPTPEVYDEIKLRSRTLRRPITPTPYIHKQPQGPHPIQIRRSKKSHYLNLASPRQKGMTGVQVVGKSCLILSDRKANTGLPGTSRLNAWSAIRGDGCLKRPSSAKSNKRVSIGPTYHYPDAPRPFSRASTCDESPRSRSLSPDNLYEASVISGKGDCEEVEVEDDEPRENREVKRSRGQRKTEQPMKTTRRKHQRKEVNDTSEEEASVDGSVAESSVSMKGKKERSCRPRNPKRAWLGRRRDRVAAYLHISPERVEEISSVGHGHEDLDLELASLSPASATGESEADSTPRLQPDAVEPDPDGRETRWASGGVFGMARQRADSREDLTRDERDDGDDRKKRGRDAGQVNTDYYWSLDAKRSGTRRTDPTLMKLQGLKTSGSRAQPWIEKGQQPVVTVEQVNHDVSLDQQDEGTCTSLKQLTAPASDRTLHAQRINPPSYKEGHTPQVSTKVSSNMPTQRFDLPPKPAEAWYGHATVTNKTQRLFPNAVPSLLISGKQLHCRQPDISANSRQSGHLTPEGAGPPNQAGNMPANTEPSPSQLHEQPGQQPRQDQDVGHPEAHVVFRLWDKQPSKRAPVGQPGRAPSSRQPANQIKRQPQIGNTAWHVLEGRGIHTPSPTQLQPAYPRTQEDRWNIVSNTVHAPAEPPQAPTTLPQASTVPPQSSTLPPQDSRQQTQRPCTLCNPDVAQQQTDDTQVDSPATVIRCHVETRPSACTKRPGSANDAMPSRLLGNSDSGPHSIAPGGITLKDDELGTDDKNQSRVGLTKRKPLSAVPRKRDLLPMTSINRSLVEISPQGKRGKDRPYQSAHTISTQCQTEEASYTCPGCHGDKKVSLTVDTLSNTRNLSVIPKTADVSESLMKETLSGLARTCFRERRFQEAAGARPASRAHTLVSPTRPPSNRLLQRSYETRQRLRVSSGRFPSEIIANHYLIKERGRGYVRGAEDHAQEHERAGGRSGKVCNLRAGYSDSGRRGYRDPRRCEEFSLSAPTRNAGGNVGYSYDLYKRIERILKAPLDEKIAVNRPHSFSGFIHRGLFNQVN